MNEEKRNMTLNDFSKLKEFLQAFLNVKLGKLYEKHYSSRRIVFECDNRSIEGYLTMDLDINDTRRYTTYEEAFVELFMMKSEKIALFKEKANLSTMSRNWNARKSNSSIAWALDKMPIEGAEKFKAEMDCLSSLERLSRMTSSQMEIEAALLGI